MGSEMCIRDSSEGVCFLSMSEVIALCAAAQKKSACESMETEDLSLFPCPQGRVGILGGRSSRDSKLK